MLPKKPFFFMCGRLVSYVEISVKAREKQGIIRRKKRARFGVRACGVAVMKLYVLTWSIPEAS